MPESPLSNEAQATMDNFAPAAPILRQPVFRGRVLEVEVVLPTTDVDGGPLTGLSSCTLFYKTTPFSGSSPEAEREAGTPQITKEVSPDMAGQTITFSIPDLSYGIMYYFAACCSD